MLSRIISSMLHYIFHNILQEEQELHDEQGLNRFYKSSQVYHTQYTLCTLVKKRFLHFDLPRTFPNLLQKGIPQAI